MIPGSIGDIEFTVSEKEVFTFKTPNRKRTLSFGEHAVMEGVPRLQHTGRKLDTLSLSIVLDALLSGLHSVNGRLDALMAMAETGEEQALVFGNAYKGEWVILDMEYTATLMVGDAILRADVTVNLSEYN